MLKATYYSMDFNEKIKITWSFLRNRKKNISDGFSCSALIRSQLDEKQTKETINEIARTRATVHYRNDIWPS